MLGRVCFLCLSSFLLFFLLSLSLPSYRPVDLSTHSMQTALTPLLTHLDFESCTLWSMDILTFLSTPNTVPLLEELRFFDTEIVENILCQQDGSELRAYIWDVAIFEDAYALIEEFLRERGLAESSRLRFFELRLMSFQEENVEDEFKLDLRRLEWLSDRCSIERGLDISLDAIPVDKLDIRAY